MCCCGNWWGRADRRLGFLTSSSNDPLNFFNQGIDVVIAEALSVGRLADCDHEVPVKLAYFAQVLIMLRAMRRDLGRMVKRRFDST
jgi:hypothetical protein